MNGETQEMDSSTNGIVKPAPKSGKTRAGFTKNHGNGTSKSVRKMAAASKRKNRGKK